MSTNPPAELTPTPGAPVGGASDAYPTQYPQTATAGYPGSTADPYGTSFGTPAKKNNPLAITSLIAGIAGMTLFPFLGSIVAVITGHLALRKIATSNEGGRGMALTGTILGWIVVVASAIGALVMMFIFIAIGNGLLNGTIPLDSQTFR